MEITYDPDADALNIVFQKGKYDSSTEVSKGIIVDYAKKGKILSIEILGASKRVNKKSIRKMAEMFRLKTNS